MPPHPQEITRHVRPPHPTDGGEEGVQSRGTAGDPVEGLHFVERLEGGREISGLGVGGEDGGEGSEGGGGHGADGLPHWGKEAVFAEEVDDEVP